MKNSLIVLTSTLPAPYIDATVSGSIILYFLIPVILIFSLAIFFGTRFFKKKMALNHNTLSGKIYFLEEQTRILLKEQKNQSAEITSLKEKLANIENKLNQWSMEKLDLMQEIQLLKDKMQNSRKNDDIIIEYYMNENSGN